MSWSFSPEAEEELDQAAAYYRDLASTAVAAAFLDEFERAARLIVEHRGLGTPASQGRWLMPLRIFPFSLLYQRGRTSTTPTWVLAQARLIR